MKMKFIYIVNVFFLLLSLGLSAFPAGPGAAGDFTNLERRLVLRAGNVFASTTNDIITNVFAPVGDGTYYCRVNLIKGSIYNFAFQVKVHDQWVWEQLPSVGSFPASVVSNTVTSNDAGRMTKIDGNIRRTITVPNYGGDTNYYVFCNFGHHPNPPDLSVTPGVGQVSIILQSKGRWDGSAEPDVVLGGAYSLYRSHEEGGPYTLLTNISASSDNITKYIDTDVTNGQTYYYAAAAYDAYQGTNIAPYDKEVDIPDFNTVLDQRYIDANMSSGYSFEKKAIPNTKVKIIFKVQNIDWDYVRENKNIVWLTPVSADARLYKNKVQARIAKIKLQDF